jgi:hypothetical protein
LGQTLDLTPLAAALQPLDGPLRTLISQAGGLLSGIPDLKFDIPRSQQSSTWLLNTYLDDTLRITRGDLGSVFVMVKEGSAARAADHSAHVASGEDVEGAWGEALGEGAAAVSTTSTMLVEAATVVEPSAVIEEGESMDAPTMSTEEDGEGI